MKLDFSRPNSNWRPKIAPNSNRTAISAWAPRPPRPPAARTPLQPRFRRAPLREVLRKRLQHAVLFGAHEVQVRHGEVVSLVRVAGGDGAV